MVYLVLLKPTKSVEHFVTILQNHLHLLTSGRAKISILVTLCGKSLDLPWLCEQGHDVVGVELSAVAAKQLFEENNIPYSVSGMCLVYQSTV